MAAASENVNSGQLKHSTVLDLAAPGYELLMHSPWVELIKQYIIHDYFRQAA